MKYDLRLTVVPATSSIACSESTGCCEPPSDLASTVDERSRCTHRRRTECRRRRLIQPPISASSSVWARAPWTSGTGCSLIVEQVVDEGTRFVPPSEAACHTAVAVVAKGDECLPQRPPAGPCPSRVVKLEVVPERASARPANSVQAIVRSQAGSPTATQPKSMTARRRPSTISRFDPVMSPCTQTAGRSHDVASAARHVAIARSASISPASAPMAEAVSSS